MLLKIDKKTYVVSHGKKLWNWNKSLNKQICLHIFIKNDFALKTKVWKTSRDKKVKEDTGDEYKITWHGDSIGYPWYSSKPESCESRSDVDNSTKLRFTRTSFASTGHMRREFASTIARVSPMYGVYDRYWLGIVLPPATPVLYQSVSR